MFSQLRSSPVGRRRGGLVSAVLWLTWVCSMLDVGDGAITRSLPCPDGNDILPCVCTAQEDFSMDMDCSKVGGSNELAWIFNQDFPFLDFNNLFIRGNTQIRTLRIGDLGHATFQRINIAEGTLESVVNGALAYSYNTLISLDLSRNHVTDFPFDELSSFKNLELLHLRHNALNSLPDIHSNSLISLQIGYNPLRTISASTIKNMPNLANIGLHSAKLTSIQPGTFTGMQNLAIVHLEWNYLTTVLTNTIHVTGTDNHVHLNGNNLVSIEINAITGANNEVWIHDNDLTELNEDVWRKMFDDNIRLSARNNSFTCGCEIAWIVLNAYYLENLMDDPACKDDTLITNLDPAIFNELCT